jgi:predicted flap endonuclease-1-like 5' DNA nuclease
MSPERAAMPSDLQDIPGIGRTLSKDFARIGVTRIANLRGKSAERLFDKLTSANADVGHPTSKNYLYVIRMAVYYADGGRDPEKLRWNAWTDAKIAPPKKKAATRAASTTANRDARSRTKSSAPRAAKARAVVTSRRRPTGP